MKILLCDGDASSRVVARRMLMGVHGCTVTECASGPEALDALDASPFDLLMLDVQMPVLDGLETLSVIRASRQLRQLPVIVLTGERRESFVRRALELGVVDYLVKPLRMERLWQQLTIVSRTTGGPDARTDHAAASTMTIESSTRVMIVDGDADFREFFTNTVSPYCTVLEASSGAGALATAAVAGPSLIFIGREIGLMGPSLLARHVAKLGAARLVKLATPDEVEIEQRARVYDEVIARTLVASVLLNDLKRFMKLAGGPLQRLVEHVPDLRASLIKVTANTFGMMLAQEIDVVEPGGAAVQGAHAVVHVVVADRIKVRVELHCSADLTRMLGAATCGDEVELADAVGVLGEMANVVTGRLQANLLESGVKCSCTLPVFGEGAAPAFTPDAGSERLAIEFAPTGSAHRFRVTLDVSEAAAAAAGSPEPGYALGSVPSGVIVSTA